MATHQKYERGNRLVRHYILQNYPEPKDFDSWLYVSQVLQAEVLKEAAEHLRRIMPRSMGSLFWQVNDCWPAISWSSIDYFGRWKALQFYARRFYRDLLISPSLSEDAIRLYVISDRSETTEALLKITLMDFHGHSILENRKSVKVIPVQSQVYMVLLRNALLDGKEPGKVFLNCELLIGGKPISSNQLFFQPFGRLSLAAPHFETSIRTDRDGLKVTLVSNKFAKTVWLSVDEDNGQFSDNYFDLIPNEPREIAYRATKNIEPEELQRRLRIRSLVNAFKN